MFGFENPILQGIIANFIFSGIQLGGKKLFSNNLSEQFELSIDNAFDKLSERYPVKKPLDGLTFWDFVSRKITEEMKHGDIGEGNLDILLRGTLDELLTDTSELENIINEFWLLFKNEIILHTELYKYLLISYQQEIKNGIFGLYDKIEVLFATLGNKEKEDITGFNEELINYIIAIQQIYINELEFDFIDRKFIFENKVSIDLNQILEEKRNILILGEPGIGKSYIAKKILFELTETREEKLSNKVPVFLNLSVYGHKFNTISNGILQLLQNYIKGIKIDHIVKFLSEGSFILILDGLDEVEQQYYESCISDLKELMQHSPSNKYILTCRENIYFDELNYMVKKVKLNPLTRDQIATYLKQYCGLRIHEIIQSQYELFENPLLLNIGIEVINSNKGKIPNNRSILFNKYIEYLSYKWERKKGLKRKYQLSYYQTILFLSKLSFNVFESPYFSTLKLYEFICKEFPDKDFDLIFEQIINIGVLKYRSDDEISFSHKTFKEYFAACYIVNSIEEILNLNILKPIIDKKQWYEVFIFAAGLFNNWNLQNAFLDYILDNNLKLYVDCIKGKNDFNNYLLSLDIHEYSIIYLNILLTSYEKMVTKYFYQFKSRFYPYNTEVEYVQDSMLSLIGQLSEDKKFLNYTFVLEKGEGERIKLLPPEETRKFSTKSMRYQSHYVNLELSNLLGDSARIVAIKDMKSELSKILKEHLLHENEMLICERVEEMKSRLPIRDIKEIDKIYDWVHTKLKEAYDRVDGKFIGYSFNGVELTDLHSFAEYLMQNKINYLNHLLPGKDNNFGGGWLWDLYTRQRLIERVRMFFYFYQLSFIYLIDNNFNMLKEFFPDYRHLPYKYFVEIDFQDNSSKGYNSEPLMSYYYIATDSAEDCIPEIKITQSRLEWEQHRNIIENSFKGKERFTNDYSVHSAGVTMTMHEGRTGKSLPLLSNTYKLVEENLKKIFGSF